MPDISSVQAKVRAARQKIAGPVDVEIPGFDGTLWGTFKPITDFERVWEIESEHVEESEARQQLLTMVDKLLEASVDTFVPQNGFVPGERHDGDRFSLEMPLGLDLARWCDISGVEHPGMTPAAAILRMFKETVGTVGVGILAAAIEAAAAESTRRAETETAKNLPAPSSQSSEQP